MKSYTFLPLFFQKIFWLPVRLAFIIFADLEVKGLENLKGLDKNVIFTPNHPSEIDPAFLPAALPFWSPFSPIFGASREKAFYQSIGWRRHIYGRWFFKIWGGYPVYTGLHDYEKSLINHIRLIQQGATLCVFPEGAKSPQNSIGPAKGGATFLAERTNTLIIPVAISGVQNVTLKDFFLRKRKFVVHFGPAITQAEIKENIPRGINFDPSIYKKEANYVMKKVGDLMEKELVINKVIDNPSKQYVS